MSIRLPLNISQMFVPRTMAHNVLKLTPGFLNKAETAYRHISQTASAKQALLISCLVDSLCSFCLSAFANSVSLFADILPTQGVALAHLHVHDHSPALQVPVHTERPPLMRNLTNAPIHFPSLKKPVCVLMLA